MSTEELSIKIMEDILEHTGITAAAGIGISVSGENSPGYHNKVVVKETADLLCLELVEKRLAADSKPLYMV